MKSDEKWIGLNDIKNSHLCFDRRNLSLRELAAYSTSEAWSIFSLHKNYVRPISKKEIYGFRDELTRGKVFNKGFENPPGSVPLEASSSGYSATSWDPFIFPNPPRLFCMSQLMSRSINPAISQLYQNNFDDLQSSFLPHHVGTLTFDRTFKKCALKRSGETIFKNSAAARFKNLDIIDLDELERMLWFDPEPRLEKPYRLYADPKYCIKGEAMKNIGNVMRPGW